MESLVLCDANTEISDKRQKVAVFVLFGYLSSPWNKKDLRTGRINNLFNTLKTNL